MTVRIPFHIKPIILAGLLTIGLVACGKQSSSVRKPQWAIPVPAQHLTNLYMVDHGVYRCEQPSVEGFAELYDMGVVEVLNLRNYHNDSDEAAGTQIKIHHVRMNAHHSKTDEFVQALQIIRNRRGPIAFHCQHGSDRTGALTALYRMVFQNWTREQAIDELENGGYGYHSVFFNIKSYLRKVDIDALKKRIDPNQDYWTYSDLDREIEVVIHEEVPERNYSDSQ